MTDSDDWEEIVAGRSTKPRRRRANGKRPDGHGRGVGGELALPPARVPSFLFHRPLGLRRRRARGCRQP